MYTVYIIGAGTALVVLAVVPAWPMYNRKPLKFLAPAGGSVSGIVVPETETKKEQ